jgi:hypothetical protein
MRTSASGACTVAPVGEGDVGEFLRLHEEVQRAGAVHHRHGVQKRRVPHIAAAQVQEPADAVGLGEEGRILPASARSPATALSFAAGVEARIGRRTMRSRGPWAAGAVGPDTVDEVVDGPERDLPRRQRLGQARDLGPGVEPGVVAHRAAARQRSVSQSSSFVSGQSTGVKVPMSDCARTCTR